jgi:cytochrome c oxidase accessory protein FixG
LSTPSNPKTPSAPFPRPDPAEDRGPVFEVAPEEDLLYSLGPDGKRRFMHPQVHRGRTWKQRLVLAWGLVLLFFALPLVRVGGHPAVHLDLATRQFHVLGATFHPTDNLLLAALGIGVIITVFFVGSTFGRLWCGYACPQTVYMEFVFRPIETWLEGGPGKQVRLDLAPWGARKAAIKAAKWLLFALVALAMSTTFVAYFAGWDRLVHEVLPRPLESTGTLLVIGMVSVAVLFDFGWFRDQMCSLACPYGRLQNVMADPDTILVAYDEKRGEPRGRQKERNEAGTPFGDCIDCRLCVTTCPTGVDIRRGLQLECIGCAQCIDACDKVMVRTGRAPGLIRNTSERELAGGGRRFWRPRVLVYLVLLGLAWGTLAAMVLTRESAQVEILRGGREPYRLLPGAEVANQQRIRITNQADEVQTFTIEVVAPKEAKLVLSDSPVRVDPAEVVTVNAVTTTPAAAFSGGQAKCVYRIASDRGFRKEVEFLLLGPFREDE